MENIVDWSELEQELTTQAGTKKMWYSILALVGILALAFLTTTVHYDSTQFTGTFGTGWKFDYNNYLSLMLGSVVSIIILGLKIQAGLKSVISKQRIIAAKDVMITKLNNAITEKDGEIAILKRQLDDACSTQAANQVALDKVKS